MSSDKTQSLLKLIFEQEESYKFIIGIAVMFVIPQIVNIVNTITKNKAIRSSLSKINKRIDSLDDNASMIKDRVNLIFNDNFEEATNSQLEAIYRGRVSIDIERLLTNTKKVIFVNHIDNKEVTKAKIISFSKVVCSNTKIVLNHFKRNGRPVGTLINDDEWVTAISSIIVNFVYGDGLADRRKYSYESLRHQLGSQFDLFIIDFINNIENDKF